jgi:hypothetical protein
MRYSVSAAMLAAGVIISGPAFAGRCEDMIRQLETAPIHSRAAADELAQARQHLRLHSEGECQKHAQAAQEYILRDQQRAERYDPRDRYDDRYSRDDRRYSDRDRYDDRRYGDRDRYNDRRYDGRYSRDDRRYDDRHPADRRYDDRQQQGGVGDIIQQGLGALNRR